MTLAGLLLEIYGWFVHYAYELFLACLAIPVAGTVLAWVAKGGMTDRGSRFIAGVVISAGVGMLVLETVVIIIARLAFEASVLDAPLTLLTGPVICLVGCLSGIHWVFPLHQLAAWRSVVDVGWFVLACLAVLWIMSKFRGWGILFGGGLLELAAIGGFIYWLIRRLYRRAFMRGHEG